MDWSLLLFLTVVLLLAFRGYRNGLLKSVSRISSVVAGYLCAILFSSNLANLLESTYQLQSVVAFITASLILFIGAGLTVSILFWVIEILYYKDDSVSAASSIGGATVGMVTGLLLGVIIVWSFAFVRDMYFSESLDTATPNTPSGIEGLTNRVAGKAMATAMSLGSATPEVANLGAALFEAPAELTQRAERLAQSEDLSKLLSDPTNQQVLNSGDYTAVQKLPAFQRLANNPDLKFLALAAGLDKNPNGGDQSLKPALAKQLTDTWMRAQAVKNDPRVQEILNDPEFQQKVRSGNPLDLITDARLLELADILFSDNVAPSNSIDQNGDSFPAKTKKDTQIYHWTDSSGRIQYSDQKPED